MSAVILVHGLLIGSFLNVCISRWPDKQSVIRPRSRCPQCRHLIAWYDNIPVISWLWLRACCRHCSKSIPWIYPAVEILTAILFLGMWRWLAPKLLAASPALPTSDIFVILVTGLLLVAAGIVVIFVDSKYMIIPDEISLNLMPLGPALCLFFPAVMTHTMYFTLSVPQAPGFMPEIYCQDWVRALLMSLGGVIVGGGLLYALSIGGEKLLKKEVMGFGDIKLLATLGGFLGIEGVILTLVLSCFLGSIFGIISLIVTRSNKIPFGPWIVIAALIIYVAKYDVLKATLQYISVASPY